MQDTNMAVMNSEGFGDAIPSLIDGLTVPQLENMLSDIRFQPLWRSEADKAADYYDSHQLTQERLEKMTRLGIPPLVTNLIAPAINAVLGMEAKTRTDWRVTQEDEAHDVPEQLMDAMNAKLSEAERESRADRAISDAYAGEVKAGLGWVEVSRPTDAFAYPYRVQSVHRSEMWWDWRAKQPDLSDARYLIRKRRFDADELTAMMPEHAGLIQYAVVDRFKTWQWDTRETWDTTLAYAAHIERITNLDASEWRDAERKRAMLFEVWYRKWVRGQVLQLPTGRKIPFRKDNIRHVQAVQAGMITPQDAVYAEVRVAFYLGPHRLYDMPSPYKHRHFPYVPFWGFREDRSQVPYGLIRAMMSPQDVVNAADAKMHWLLNARRLIMDSDALDKSYNSIRQVQEELSRPDAAVITDPAKPGSRFKVESDFELNAQQFQRRMQASSDIENAGGIYKAMLGRDSNTSSGIAINSLVEQGMVTLAEINDNAQFARRQVGELLFSLVREDLMVGEFDVAIKKGRKKIIVTLNKRVVDPATRRETIQNNVAAVPAKVVLEDVPSTPAFRAQQLQMLTEITKSIPKEYQGVLIPFVMDLTDVPRKDELVGLLRKVGGVPEDLSEEAQAQADAQTRAQAADAAAIARANAVATVKKTDAEGTLALARAHTLDAAIPDQPGAQPPPAPAPTDQPAAPDVTWQ